MENKNIIVQKNDKGIVRLTINRPETRNALNRATRTELLAAVQELKTSDARVVIITGAGDKSFVSGADLNDFKGLGPMEIDQFVTTVGASVYAQIEALQIPVIAMINGFCFGGGMELAMSCDIRVASSNSKFGQLEINVGFFPGGGGTQRLPRLIGWGRAKDLIYTGRQIDATTAEKWGLIDRLVAPENLEAEVTALAETLASKSPVAMKLTKQCLNQAMYSDLASGLTFERKNLAVCFASHDTQEGISAFLEKRSPKFTGK